MNDKQYHNQEMKRAFKHYAEIQTIPRREREENYREFLEADPDFIAQQIEWIFNGSYGYGEMHLALNTLSMRNPAPSLYHLVSSLNWQTGDYYSRKAWKATPKAKQDSINKAVNEVIREYRENKEATQ